MFTWYHPLGGEYLFAYDHNQCTAEVEALGMSPGADQNGPFFTCMRDRGYSLIGTDIVAAETNTLDLSDRAR